MSDQEQSNNESIEELREKLVEFNGADGDASSIDYADLFNSMEHGVIYQSSDGRIITMNTAAESILNTAKDQLMNAGDINQHLAMVDEDKVAFPQENHPTMQALRTGKPVRNVVMGYWYEPEKAYRWITVSAVPQFRNGEKVPYRVFVTFADITQLKTAEEETELRGLLLDKAVDSICLIDRSGVLCYVNEVFCELHGYQSEELLGRNIRDVEMVADAELQERIDRDLSDTGYAIFEISHRRKDGAPVNLEIHSRRIYLNGKHYSINIERDINERKKMERALADSERNFRNTIDHSPLGIIINRDFGTPLYANRSALDLFGYENFEEMKSIPSTERHVPENVRAIQARLQRFSNYESLTETDRYYVRRKSGEYRFVEVHVNKVVWNDMDCVMVTLQDITDKNKAEQLLTESERRFRELFEHMSSGVAVYEAVDDGQDFVFIDFNKAAERIDSISRDDVLGKRLTEVYPGVKEFGIFEVLHRVWETGVSENHPISWYKDDRIAGWRENYIYKLASGELVAMYDDITEKKQAEERAKELQKKLIVTDRLASVGELAAGIAHELNNPLTGVIGFSDLLLDRAGLPEDVRNDVEVINREALRASQVARHLLTFARRHPDDKELVDVGAVLKTVLELRAYEHRTTNITVNLHIEDKLPKVMGNDFQLQQVFLNIIINAEFFMVTEHGKGNLAITAEKNNDVVRISFTDDGPGIPEEHRAHIFDPFYTTKDVGQGTGLGLSICYGIITEHGGTISVASSRQAGTTFIIDLPAFQPS